MEALIIKILKKNRQKLIWKIGLAEGWMEAGGGLSVSVGLDAM